jgi:mannitol 2-dehydrogenase
MLIRDKLQAILGMVDRITPVTGDNERQRCEEFGVMDAEPVFCEEFRQWVIEDNFPSGRPDLHPVGVTFVEDVTLHENMKLRILNGGHLILAHLGMMLQHKYVS